MHFLVLFIVLCISFIPEINGVVHRELLLSERKTEGVALSSLPSLEDVDSIELYHLRSFRKQLIKTNSASFSIQTSALALRSTTTNTVVVLEYRPVSYEASYLPRLRPSSTNSDSISTTKGIETNTGNTGNKGTSTNSKNADKNRRDAFYNITGNIYWDTRAVIEYSTSLNIERWEQSTFLGMVNGIVYSNYATWLESYISKQFVPQSICSSPSSGVFLDEVSCFVVSNTWDTFVAASLNKFASMSVSMHAMLPPRASEMQVLSNSVPIKYKADRQSTNHGNTNTNTNTGQNNRSRNKNSVTRSLDGNGNGDVDVDEVDHIAESDIVYYYTSLITCMNGYTNEDFTSALTSCIPPNAAFVHIKDELYYQIQPRHPFVVNTEYLHFLPIAQYPKSRGVLLTDWIIGCILLLIVFVGFLLGLKHLKFYEACCSSGQSNSRLRKPKIRHSGGIMDGVSMRINSMRNGDIDGSPWSSNGGYSKVVSGAGASISGDLEMMENPVHISAARSKEDYTVTENYDDDDDDDDKDTAYQRLKSHITVDTPTVLNVPSSIFANYRHRGHSGGAGAGAGTGKNDGEGEGTASKNDRRRLAGI
jgi:hypothetical protein